MAPKEKDPQEQGGFIGMIQNFLSGDRQPKTVEPPVGSSDAPAGETPPTAEPGRPPAPAEISAPDGEPLEGEPAGEEPENENVLPVKGNPLYELYLRRQGVPPIEDETLTFNLSLFTETREEPGDEQRSWLRSFESPARRILQKSREAEEAPIDHVPLVRISRNRMSAWYAALPPTFEGEDMTVDSIKAALAEAGVIFGLDEIKIGEIAGDKRYFTLFEVAFGMDPEDGEDGSIVDHYEREVDIHLQVKDDNTIDYKDLGWLQTVTEGDVICDIIPPTQAHSGTNVLGGEVRGRDGKKAIVPKGQGTRTSEDGLLLEASLNGVLSFDVGRFRVDPLLIIEGSVETATGNIEMVGDVLVHGDILEGFTVEATGNITVQGMIEGAKVVAGGDIQVGRGMNGNSHGMMQAKGEVRSKFIENASVTAGGKIICDTIINSTISSDEAIEVKTGRGAIIGGNITALERIDALSIGNQSNRSIVITMGSTTNFLRDKRELEEKKEQLTNDVKEIEKNITFLDAGATNPAPALSTMLDDLKLKLTVQKMQLANVERRLAQMQKKHTDNTQCRLRAEVIYPPAQITIGHVTKILREMSFSALVYLKNGDVHVGNV